MTLFRKATMNAAIIQNKEMVHAQMQLDNFILDLHGKMAIIIINGEMILSFFHFLDIHKLMNGEKILCLPSILH